MKILAFKSSPLGDTVMFLPVAQGLRRGHPDGTLTVFTAPAATPLFRGLLPPENVIAFEPEALRRLWRTPWRLLRWRARIRREHFDAVLLSYDQSSVARFLAAQSGARVRVAGGASVVRWQGGVTAVVEHVTSQSLAEWDWAIAGRMMEAFGQPWPDEPPAPQLPVPLASAPSATRRARPRVVIHPGASRPYQRWLPERFAALATMLAAEADVVWVERPEVAVAAPPGATAHAPRTLDEFLPTLAGADLFVGNHSGAFHLAAALGTPCVIVAGPSPTFCDPPWHRDRRRILRAPGLACLPCDRLIVSAGSCRNLATPMACMEHWSVEAVAQVCREWLRRGVREGAR